MVKRIFIDIESVPPPEEWRSLIKSETVRKLCRKSSFALAVEQTKEEQQGCTEEQFRQLALHAEYGRVLAIGMIVEYDWHVTHCGLLGRERSSGRFHLDEARTLRSFWKMLSDFDSGRDLIIGHNIMDFDLPFLYKRSRINRIHPSVILSFARYRSAPIYDTMREWAQWNPYAAYNSLAELAEILKVGITKTEGMEGDRIYDQFLANNHDLIAEYCMRDVQMARAVFYRMVFPEVSEPAEAVWNQAGTKTTSGGISEKGNQSSG
ncbi:MAG: ribonuclease H-like domain-containing protein [Pyrinomonadaceae bacterium]